MTDKIHIIDSLGERRLVLPALVNSALVANDRSKYYFTLLQAAVLHAEHPEQPITSLHLERLSCGITESKLDNIIANSERVADKRYRIPESSGIVQSLMREVGVMLQPLLNGKEGELSQRLNAIKKDGPTGESDILTRDEVESLTSGNRDRGDSLHILVMDAHKRLNALQKEIASETVDGASVYGLASADKPLIRAFMRGLRRTAMLKFDHPGLGTTATRVRNRLVVQNDIGTTDAHVLIVHVEDRRATVTYTDVHLQRLLFFQRLFEGRRVQWNDTVSRRDEALEDSIYHVCVGTFAAESDGEIEEYLEFLGSRLVFLIDWNRARKRLRALVSKGAALKLLAWAADQEHGHMAFLKAGGEQLVYDALDFVVRGQARFGERLDEILGAKEATEYLQFVLRTCAVSALRGEPGPFIQDAIRAELFHYFRTRQQLVYELAAEHAALILEIAGGVRDSVLQMGSASSGSALEQNAKRAKDWERRADDVVNRTRSATKHADSAAALCKIIESADDIADELEEAAFRLTLIPADLDRRPQTDLHTLGELLVAAAQEYVKVVETARYIRRGGSREDVQDFLDAVHRVIALEQQTDAAQRDVEATLAATAPDFRVLHVLAETTKNLEQAADALMHSTLQMRDYVLGEVMSA